MVHGKAKAEITHENHSVNPQKMHHPHTRVEFKTEEIAEIELNQLHNHTWTKDRLVYYPPYSKYNQQIYHASLKQASHDRCSKQNEYNMAATYEHAITFVW